MIMEGKRSFRDVRSQAGAWERVAFYTGSGALPFTLVPGLCPLHWFRGSALEPVARRLCLPSTSKRIANGQEAEPQGITLRGRAS